MEKLEHQGMRRSRVFSPYFPENEYVNPNFPFGASQQFTQKSLNRQSTVIKDCSDTFKKSKAEKTLLKKKKREALPFSNKSLILS